MSTDAAVPLKGERSTCAGESATDPKRMPCMVASGEVRLAKLGYRSCGGSSTRGTWAFGGLPSGQLRDTLSMVNGCDNLKLGAGLMRRDDENNPATPKSDLLLVGASYNVTPAFKFVGELFRPDYKNSPNKANLLVLRATHPFSKRTAVYASLGRISGDDTLAVSVSGGVPGSRPVAGGSQSGLKLGVRHNF